MSLRPTLVDDARLHADYIASPEVGDLILAIIRDEDPTSALEDLIYNTPICPECGSPVVRFRRPSASDPDDPEPGAYCTDPDCPFAY